MISDRVWRKGWEREAAATQAASRQLAAFIGWCEALGLRKVAADIRHAAMEGGAVETVADLHNLLARQSWQR